MLLIVALAPGGLGIEEAHGNSVRVFWFGLVWLNKGVVSCGSVLFGWLCHV